MPPAVFEVDSARPDDQMGWSVMATGLLHRKYGETRTAQLRSRLEPWAKGVRDRPALPELTDRERQVLALLASGRTTADIAARLAVSPKTVRNHLSSVFAKLHVSDRTQAVLRARDAGLLE